MENTYSSGTMTLTSPTALALWENEIRGQISDGAWENARPYDHWLFWCHIDARLGDKNETISAPGHYPLKTGYNLAVLREYVEPRMLACGRMALAGGTSLNALHASEYLLEMTFESFAAAKASGKWKYDFLVPYMADVSLELAEKFYANPNAYTVKNLRKDFAVIKEAMKHVRSVTDVAY